MESSHPEEELDELDDSKSGVRESWLEFSAFEFRGWLLVPMRGTTRWFCGAVDCEVTGEDGCS